jgi:hypothetical protein
MNATGNLRDIDGKREKDGSDIEEQSFVRRVVGH